MRQLQHVDIAVIGAGPAGLAAAAAARSAGAAVIIIERDDRAGGILNQCIHDGFGLQRFDCALTGGEYAHIDELACRDAGVELLTDTYVSSIERTESGFALHTMTTGLISVITATAVILAMGCRERAAGAISLPGTRPAGIYTAGTAQRLTNMQNIMTGSRFLIIGSGDIGLIMARRVTLEGGSVAAVTEIQPYPGGLDRNIRQCLTDFSIPLYLETGIVEILGTDRVTGALIAPVGRDGLLDTTRSTHIPCDTILLSVGLIPENELTRSLDAVMDPVTGGPAVDEHLMTSVPGLFACGNVLQVHDVVDLVSQEAAHAGTCAAAYLRGERAEKRKTITLQAGEGIRYVLPQSMSAQGSTLLSCRVRKPMEDVTIQIRSGSELIYRQQLPYVQPSEMIQIPLDLSETAADTSVEVHCVRT
ncbi:MAG: NAD(P)/FAD-dependent oxidoreductase [Spirochaetia bacterium]|nr:NAD(P)/FAD-dependent oxidoreductase [Spirochaetia bacterium]